MKQTNVKQLVIVGFFAALIFLGIQIFRIPMPAAVGTPFLHFGHIFVVLAVMCLGPKFSAVAAVLGFVVFDIINGYIHAIPNVFVSAILNCVIAGSVFLLLIKRSGGDKKKQYFAALVTAVIYGLLNIIIDFIWQSITLVIAGSSLKAALAAELTSIPATIINSGFMVLGIALLYVPVKSGFDRMAQG